MRLILVGNPNSGKTTVFNHLTGGHQHIGNFPGITVEFRSGICGHDEIVDLPGLYSLEPHSAEERVAARYLKENPPDGIINCVDMTNLRRSLALTLSLMELQVPMILVANMLDECRPQPEPEKLEQWLGIPVFGVRQQNRWAPAVLIRQIRGEIQRDHRPTPLCRGSMEEKYRWIDGHLPFSPPVSKRRGITQKWDRILLHPVWGTVIFLGIMGGIFELAFRRLGPLLTAHLTAGPERLAAMAGAIGQPFTRAVIQGAISGVGTVMSFLPAMMLLFFFLSLLEDSGYMVRICYLAENIMRFFGLSGRSTVPLLIGFGCSVPAVLAARTMESTAQRKKTIRAIPFVSCSAKLPIYGILASTLCPDHSGWVLMGIYLTGILVGLLVAALSPRKAVPMILEKPPYRFPKLKNLWFRLWGQTKAFVQKAFTVLLLASVLAAVLQQFTPALQYTEDPAESILAAAAKIPVPLFRPLGLGQWELIAALIAGLFAKESIVSVLAVLGPQIADPLPFLVFIIFYPPCVAAMSTIRREAGWRFAAMTFFLHLGLAYIAAWIATLL